MNSQKTSLTESKQKKTTKSSVSAEELLHSDSPLSFLVNSFTGALALYEFDLENAYIKRLRENETFFAACNITKEEYASSYEGNLFDIIHPEDSPEVLQMLMGLEVQGKAIKAKVRGRRKNASDAEQYKTASVEIHALTRTKEKLCFIAIFKRIEGEETTQLPKIQVNFTNNKKQQLSTYSSTKKTGHFTIRFDDPCHLVCADDSFFEICEISREEGEKRAQTILYDILYPEDVQHIFSQIEKNLVSGESNIECYVRFLTYKKNTRVVRETGKIRKEMNGIFIDVEVTDLTDVSIGHRKLDANEVKLQSSLSSSAVTIWDIKKKSCMWSKEIQLIFGIPAVTENLIDTLCAPNILHDNSAELLKNIIQRLIGGEVNITEDLWFDKHDKKPICRRTTFFAEHDEGGKMIKVCAIGQDVTKEVLGAEYIDIEKIIEGMPGGIVVVDAETEVLRYANDDYFKIIGVTREELKNRYANTPRRLVENARMKHLVGQIAATIKKTGRAMFEGETISPDGRKIWVRSDIKRIGKNLFCTVTDITNHKRIISELKNEQLFQQMASGIMHEIIFKCDMQTNMVQYIGRAIENFNLRTTREDYPASIIDRNVIYNEDVSIFMNMMKNMADGKEIPCELRLKDISGSVEWYRVEYQIAFENKKPIYAVGKIINIEKEKMIAVQTAIDSLTGCFNSGVTKISIQQVLDEYVEGMQHAFMIINIDNFKNINDTLGSTKSDSVLKELAIKMKNIFRSSDFVGRTGGDEFVIFMCDYGDCSMLKLKLANLVKSLQNTYTCIDDDCFVSASIGVALCPDNGLSYEDLYNNADFALYEAKGRGKNQFCIFSPGRCNR